jgi:lysophospholipase L1-like esterase
LLVVSFAATTLLAECALRIVRSNPYRDERPDRVLRLGIHHSLKNLPVDRSAIDPESPIARLRTDERGYLTPSVRFEQPHATIVFLGGSTTECSALDDEERWPARVSALLEERGLRVNVLNAGKSGNTSHDALNVLLNHVVHDRPDVAVLMEAANDYGLLSSDSDYRSRSGAPMTVAIPMRWALQSLSAHSALAGALRQVLTVRSAELGDFRRPVRGRTEPVADTEFAHRLRAFIGVCRAFGIEPVLMTQPFAPARTQLSPDWIDASDQERFNETIRTVARAEDAVLIDLARHIVQDVEGWDRPMRVFYDGIHVTAQGATRYADYVTARLVESVPRLRPHTNPLAGHAATSP